MKEGKIEGSAQNFKKLSKGRVIEGKKKTCHPILGNFTLLLIKKGNSKRTRPETKKKKKLEHPGEKKEEKGNNRSTYQTSLSGIDSGRKEGAASMIPFPE